MYILCPVSTVRCLFSCPEIYAQPPSTVQSGSLLALPQLCHCVVAVVGDLVPARDQEHGVHGPGPQQAQLHPGRRHPRPLPLLSLQGEVPQERPAQVPHVRQPPRAHRAQSETATDEDEEISGKEWNLNTSFGVNLVPTFLPI